MIKVFLWQVTKISPTPLVGLGAHKRKGNLGFLTETTILCCQRISQLTPFLGLTWFLVAYAEMLQGIPVLPTLVIRG